MFQTIFKLSDTAISVLLLFFSMFFKTVTHHFKLLIPESFLSKLPQNIRAARALASNGLDCRNNFVQYVCCPNCHTLYSKDQAILKPTTGNMQSKKCDFIKFPNHPQRQHRIPCGTELMKNVKSPTGKYLLQPKLVYCYKSVIESLKEMVKRPGFVQKCEEWRNLQTIRDNYNDVYDSNIWKEFQSYNNVPFLAAPFTYALHLNTDWFQPFDHTQHSEGVIYLTVYEDKTNKNQLIH